MAQTKREQYERKREHTKELADQGEITSGELDALLTWVDSYDPEKAILTPSEDSGVDRWGDSRQPTTLRQWLLSVVQYARVLDTPVTEATAHDFNRVSQSLYDGTADIVKDSGLSKNTIRTRQNCLVRFLGFADTEAEADEIAVFDMESTIIDPEDMLTPDEFHALRNAAEHPRDRVLVDMFLYTGQRNHALRTLRIKDIDLDDGKYRLNPEVDGLKGADLIGTWNPLLGAVGTLRDWFKNHPDPDDPNAYVLTERRDSISRDAHSTISDDTVNRVLREVSKRAAVDEPGIENKPTHAHAMRHNFVTMCKRDYDLDDDVIKRLIRHRPESDVMSTTYAHLSDEDYIKKAEEAFGFREKEDTSPMTPKTCDTCHEPLAPNAKACANCGAVYTPDAEHAQQQIADEKQDVLENADSVGEIQDADKVERILKENPELAVEILQDEL